MNHLSFLHYLVNIEIQFLSNGRIEFFFIHLWHPAAWLILHCNSEYTLLFKGEAVHVISMESAEKHDTNVQQMLEFSKSVKVKRWPGIQSTNSYFEGDLYFQFQHVNNFTSLFLSLNLQQLNKLKMSEVSWTHHRIKVMEQTIATLKSEEVLI